jgi:hypothetical protein
VIELHAVQLAGQIEADHIYSTELAGSRRAQRVCLLCARPAPCPARLRAADLRAGRVDASGRPL